MEYVIKDRFTIASKGEQVEADIICLSAPSGKVAKYIARIDQEIAQAIMKVSENSKSDSLSKEDASLDNLSGEEIIFMLASSGFDIEKSIDNFKWVLKLTCFVNETSMITDSIADKISYKDMKEMMGLYIKSFLFISQVN